MAYCTRSDIEAIYGKTVAAWADVDQSGDQTAISNRIEHAISVAENEIDAMMRNSWLAVPLRDQAGGVPPLITEIAATLAGVWLYELRGVEQVDERGQPIHRLALKRQWALQTLEAVRRGVMQLDLAKA